MGEQEVGGVPVFHTLRQAQAEDPPRCPTLWIICTFLKAKTSIMSNLEVEIDQNLRSP